MNGARANLSVTRLCSCGKAQAQSRTRARPGDERGAQATCRGTRRGDIPNQCFKDAPEAAAFPTVGSPENSGKGPSAGRAHSGRVKKHQHFLQNSSPNSPRHS